MVADLLGHQPLTGYDPEAVSAACAAVRSLCGWHIAPVETMTVAADVATSGVVNLPSLYVADVTSVTDTFGTVPFTWDGGLQDLRLGCTGRRRRVLVTITHGYDNCPEDLRQAIGAMATLGGGPRVRSESGGPYRVEFFDDGLTTDAAIRRYSLPAVA